MATCSRCGTTEPTGAPGDVPLGWSLAVEGGRRTVTCARCAREHIRAIEGKLDDAWW